MVSQFVVIAIDFPLCYNLHSFFFSLFCSSIVCEQIKTDGGLKLLADIVKDPNTPVEQLEKVMSFKKA